MAGPGRYELLPLQAAACTHASKYYSGLLPIPFILIVCLTLIGDFSLQACEKCTTLPTLYAWWCTLGKCLARGLDAQVQWVPFVMGGSLRHIEVRHDGSFSSYAAALGTSSCV
jgi:hypothetical protein